jgi:hypothetical protein
LDNEFVHLTNNAIQKNNPTYGQFESGNILSFSEFNKYLTKQQNSDRPPVDFEAIYNRMKYQAEVTMLSVSGPRPLHFYLGSQETQPT